MDKFRYSPTPSSDIPPSSQPSNSAPKTCNLILPDAAKNANYDLNIFGSFAGPIPTGSPQFTYNSNNNNNNNGTPTLRFILGNRVNIPPAQK